MEPRVTEHEPSIVLGVVTQVRRGSETPELFASIWSDFESRRQEIAALAVEDHYFGVRFPTAKEDVTDYLAGMIIGADVPVLEGLEKRTVPGGKFAVFECAVEAIGDTYRQIFTVWLPGASAQLDSALPVFEEYSESTSQKPVCIHVPVRPKSAKNGNAG